MRLFTILIVAVLLSGCSSWFTKTKIEYRDKVIVLDIPKVYLNQCSVSMPPIKLDYIKLPYKDKESVLTDYSMALLSDLNACNIQQTGLNDWYVKQRAIYNPDVKK